jgi:hypothetical protein
MLYASSRRESFPAEYPAARSKNHFGDCLVTTQDLEIGTIVAKFITTPTNDKYKASSDTPFEHRHVVQLGYDDKGNALWGRVISDARFINHSCDPNCIVNNDNEVITIRTVTKGKELTVSYDAGTGEWDPDGDFSCLCQSEICRGLINKRRGW